MLAYIPGCAQASNTRNVPCGKTIRCFSLVQMCDRSKHSGCREKREKREKREGGMHPDQNELKYVLFEAGRTR